MTAGEKLCRIIIVLCNAYMVCNDTKTAEKERMLRLKEKYLKMLEK